MYDFKFDEWAALAESDPAAFERKRKEVLDAEILKAPVASRNNLRMLQMECDAIRKSMDPMEASAAMLGMAQASLQKLKTPLTQLRAECEDILESMKDASK